MKKFTLTLLALGSWLLALTAQVANTDTTDTGVLINGVVWATRNVDAPGKFAQNPEDIGMIYQYNIRVGWRYAREYADILGTDGSTVWNTTPAPYSPVWEEENDPCPIGWRVPTPTEMQSLIDAGSYLEYGSVPNGCSWCPIYRVYGSNEYGVVDNTVSLNLIGKVDYHTGIDFPPSSCCGNSYWCNTASYYEILQMPFAYILFNYNGYYESAVGEVFAEASALVRCVKKNGEIECINTLNVFSNDNNLGDVIGTNMDGSNQIIISTPDTTSAVFCGTIELIAIEKENTVFTSWNDGILINPRHIYVTKDTTFVANFTAISASVDVLAESIKILPNPVKDVLHIINNEHLQSGTKLIINSLEICDITGNVLFTVHSSNNSIDVSSLTQGIYLLKINTDRGIVIEKFIKK